MVTGFQVLESTNIKPPKIFFLFSENHQTWVGWCFRNYNNWLVRKVKTGFYNVLHFYPRFLQKWLSLVYDKIYDIAFALMGKLGWRLHNLSWGSVICRSQEVYFFNTQNMLFFLNSFGDLFVCTFQHCFIWRPSGSTVSQDAGIEPRTVATL